MVLVLLTALPACRTRDRAQRSAEALERAEVRARFALIRSHEEAIRGEIGRYYASTEHGEEGFAAPDTEARWKHLGIEDRPWDQRCRYVVVVGQRGSLAGAGPRGRALLGGSPPTRDWYYLRARCDAGARGARVDEATSESPEPRRLP
jgi:hypothetical protein